MPPVKPKKAAKGSMPAPSELDFATVLAAGVHDMKNSLFLLLQSIEEVAAEVESPQHRSRLADIHYETQRLNTGLMQLLSLYRQNNNALPVNKDEQFIDELADDLMANNQFYAEHHGVQLTTETINDSSWYFDHNLILVLLNDVVINALRYAKTQVHIQLSIDSTTHELVIEVFDDGPGYPDNMLDMHICGPAGIKLSSGRTGLGLYFSHLIAQAHQTGEKQGSITLTNDSPLGGSRFTLRLP